MFKHILVPTDGSALSEQTVARAVLFAKECGSRVTFFYAQPAFELSFGGEGALIILFSPDFPKRYAKAAEEKADYILKCARTMAERAGVIADTDTIVSALPYKAIIESAEQRGCDLIIMASHGRHGVAGLLLGSETQKVLIHSKIPVLVNR